MKKYSKVVSGLLAMCMAASLAVPTSANSLESLSSNDPDVCTGSGVSTMVGATENSARIGITIGHCGGEWNSVFNWGRAYSGVWSWGSATYLYVKATVTANGETSKSTTKSSTASQKITTDKIYQSTKDGRTLTAYHIVRGYWGAAEDGDYRSESYSGEWEF